MASDPRTKYANLTLKELVQLHRWDIQGDELVEELWQRIEEVISKEEAK
jgi:hypothetical protein